MTASPASEPRRPEPLRGAETGTFAHKTVTERMPEIVRRVLAENDLPRAAAARLEALIEELPHASVRPLRDAAAPDVEDWTGYLAPHGGRSWLEVPWFFAETYFYRRIMEAVGYFGSGAGERQDPFAYQKRRGLETSRPDIRSLAARLAEAYRAGGWQRETFVHLLYLDLWGNQADLSLWPAGEEGQPRHADLSEARAHLLADDSAAAADHVAGLEGDPVAFVVDNAGFEFVGDLCLADYLLQTGRAGTVHLHLKAHPTFVSDAIPADLSQTIDFFEEEEPPVQTLGSRLRGYLEEERLLLQADLYWTSPLAGWEMPEGLREELARTRLVISKGDANYRRLLGDRHWPFTTPFQEAVGYFPAPLLALRTLKSEVAAGLAPGCPEALSQQDPEWITGGRWGVVQFVPKE